MKKLFVLLFLVSEIGLAQTTSTRVSRPTYTGELKPTNSSEVPEEIKGVNIVEQLGEKIDLSLPVRNEAGETVPLSSIFNQNEAVMLSPMYYNCPGLCNFHFNGVVEALKKIDWTPGEKFEVVAFSFDAKESAELATKKKANYMKMYNRPGSENGFHFLTAEQNTIDQLMKQIGFQFKWNEKTGEWSHASAAIMISPNGTVTRYLHGVEFNPPDLKLALNETAKGKVGNVIDAIVLFCFSYDTHKSKYGLQAFRVVQLGGLATVLILSMWLLPVLFRSRREKV